MKVALVFPRTRYPSGDPPLGIAYLAAAVRARTGIVPDLIDTTFSGNPVSFLRERFSEKRYDLVGISAMVTMSRELVVAARLAKEANPDCVVVAGGPHPTTLKEAVLGEEAINAVVAGEGEEVFAALVEREGDFRGLPGVFYREGSGIAGEAPRLVEDLDALPFPALELLPMEQYLANWFQLDSVASGLGGTNVLATRGCPFRCSYCQPTLETLFGRGVRKRSPGNVADELEELKDRYGIRGFLFADDTFILDRKWVFSFCRELEERKLGLAWGCNVRADLVSEGLLRAMKEAGLGKIYIGIEVYDDATRREVFNKKLTREQVESAVEWARSLGIRTQGYFMLGAPGESRGDVWNTVRYAWRLPLDDATFNLTTPLPGTFLFERFQHLVGSPPEEMDYYQRYAFRGDGVLDARWLKAVQRAAYLGFYGTPSRALRQARSLLSWRGLKRFYSKARRVF